MRRILLILLTIVLLSTLITGVSAATSATKVESYATVSPDGSCQVTATVYLHLDEPKDGLTFPVPEGATNVTVNGSRVRSWRSGGALQLDLNRAFGSVTGDISFTVNYTLHGVVVRNEIGGMELRLPMVSGFAYPIDHMSFSVTLPGEVKVLPAFSSGYYQTSIEKYLTCSVEGAAVTGATTQELKDHETMVMTLPVDSSMFHSVSLPMQSTPVDDIAMAVCGALALLYWLIFLRAPFPRKRAAACPPDGYSAGQAGSILFLQGCDLSVMVLTWARLGYVQLRRSRGRVTIIRQMDMGNERGAFERKCFKRLFAKRDTVDTGSNFYAGLCKNLDQSRTDASALLRSRTGNPRIFRIFAALIGLFSGVGVGIAISSGGFLQGLWIVMFAILGGILAWLMHGWAACMLLRDRRAAWRALAAAAVWLLLGLVSGEIGVALGAVAAQVLAGVLLAMGGRRTEAGRQVLEQTLGLRSYLKKLTPAQVRSACASDPDFFYNMAPWAVALGVDRRFARHFAGEKLPACLYIVGDKESPSGPMQANAWLRQVLADMDRKWKGMPMERLKKTLAGIRKK